MINNVRYTETQIIKKYKRSIFVDQLISFIPVAVSIFSKNIIDPFDEGFGYLLIGMIFILTSLLYFTSDHFMNKSSIGKKIYGIEILVNNKTRKLLLLSVILRRLIEFTYHPLFKQDFVSITRKIETYTNTCIVEKNHKDVIKSNDN